MHRDAGQGEIAPEGFEADGGGKAVSVAGEEGLEVVPRSGRDKGSLFIPVSGEGEAASDSWPLYFCHWRRADGRDSLNLYQ